MNIWHSLASSHVHVARHANETAGFTADGFGSESFPRSDARVVRHSESVPSFRRRLVDSASSARTRSRTRVLDSNTSAIVPDALDEGRDD